MSRDAFRSLQDVFNLLPNLDVDAIIKAFTLQVWDVGCGV
jgi:hypothetical protein